MLFTSPRTTALNHTLHSSPITTSPTIVALGAIKQFSPHLGVLSSTGKISAIRLLIDSPSKLSSLRTLHENPLNPCAGDLDLRLMNLRQLFLQHVAQTSTAPLSLEIERAEGCILTDAGGKEYIDLIGGISVANTGHRHPRVVAA